jgi:hypothetical protein
MCVAVIWILLVLLNLFMETIYHVYIHFVKQNSFWYLIENGRRNMSKTYFHIETRHFNYLLKRILKNQFTYLNYSKTVIAMDYSKSKCHKHNFHLPVEWILHYLSFWSLLVVLQFWNIYREGVFIHILLYMIKLNHVSKTTSSVYYKQFISFN